MAKRSDLKNGKILRRNNFRIKHLEQMAEKNYVAQKRTNRCHTQLRAAGLFG
jgi:hypothetical protein